MLTSDHAASLVSHAVDARRHAYAPYSNFSVGAAVLTDDGRVFTGANVENASLGLTICAERVALTAAVAAGCRRFAGLAVATTGGHAPCGACRQVAAEFRADLPILLIDVDRDNAVLETTLDVLLPATFRFRQRDS